MSWAGTVHALGQKDFTQTLSGSSITSGDLTQEESSVQQSSSKPPAFLNASVGGSFYTYPVEIKKKVVKSKKKVTWRDNPYHCNQDIEWIAAEPPFKCIKKKAVVVGSTANVSQPSVYGKSIVSGCGDNQYAHFIYMHESGCNLNAVNAGGCRGIGQACPGSKLPCGADYACQNAFFTAYANSAYGGWAGAYNFWLAHRWW